MFPKLWNAIEIDLKETKSAKIFKQRVINIYLENYERFKCKKNFISLFVFVHPPSLTPWILIYLSINPSDLTLQQIT